MNFLLVLLLSRYHKLVFQVKFMMPPKPVIAIGSFWRRVVENLSDEQILDREAKAKLNVSKCSELVTFVRDIDEAVKEILVKI